MNIKIEEIVEGGVFIALATVLSLITIYKMPQGGSITAASMAPIIIYSIRWGVKKGLIAGAIYGLIQFFISPYFLSPMQFLLDYIIAYSLLGIAGLGKRNDFELMNVLPAAGLAMVARALSHILAGVFFFAEYAGDQNPWIYSSIYNFSYMIPELIITTIIISLLNKPLINIFKRSKIS